jgi:cytochrome bd-type quinol oxidase subunit 1
MGSILAGGAIKAIGGATQAISGLVNAKGLKREQREKRAEYEQQKQAMKNFQFSNPWANMENTADFNILYDQNIDIPVDLPLTNIIPRQ